MNDTFKTLCANGLKGFDLVTGKEYMPRDACRAKASTGHIFCPACRADAGGLQITPKMWDDLCV